MFRRVVLLLVLAIVGSCSGDLPGSFGDISGRRSQAVVRQGDHSPGMKNHMKILISILVLILPNAASAALDDAAYCKSLAATYENLLM